MIPLEQRLVAIVFSLILFFITVQLIRKHKLREQYALVWFVISGLILLLSVFGRILPTIAERFQVSYPPVLILALGILFAITIILSQTVILSTQADRIRDLAQTTALLEFRLRQLENQPQKED